MNILAYSSSATGTAKLEEISSAYVEVWNDNENIDMKKAQINEDHQQIAMQQGSEDPQSKEILQKWDKFLPGQVE